jgi:hypothetical protein
MEIHKPKPWHGWREFLKEYAIIVLGVLTALGAEQVVENMRWREKVDQTNGQLRAELHDDARSAYRWLAVRQCLQGQLDTAEAVVVGARDTGEIRPIPAYTPPLVMFTSDAWLNARSLQVADHVGPQVMRDYALIYFFPRELELNIVQLRQLAAELRPLVGRLRHISSEEAGGYQRLIGKIHELQARTELAETLLLQRSAASGILLSKEEMRGAVEAARKDFGACAGPPDLNRS